MGIQKESDVSGDAPLGKEAWSFYLGTFTQDVTALCVAAPTSEVVGHTNHSSLCETGI